MTIVKTLNGKKGTGYLNKKIHIKIESEYDTLFIISADSGNVNIFYTCIFIQTGS